MLVVIVLDLIIHRAHDRIRQPALALRVIAQSLVISSVSAVIYLRLTVNLRALLASLLLRATECTNTGALAVVSVATVVGRFEWLHNGGVGHSDRPISKKAFDRW